MSRFFHPAGASNSDTRKKRKEESEVKRKQKKDGQKKERQQAPGLIPGPAVCSDTKKDMHFCISSSGLGC